MTRRDQFLKYLDTSSQNRTGKATSYVQALDLLSEMLAAHPSGFSDCLDIWSVQSIERLQELYLRTREETRNFKTSQWRLPHHPPSYLKDGYCSAALRAYQNFLLEYDHTQDLLTTFHDHTGPEEGLAQKLNKPVPISDELIDAVTDIEGLDRVTLTRTRINQNVFRAIILDIYSNTCCVTGLDLPAVNRASHIIPWSERPDTRMDPRNGICLSATYDAAFDRHLISLDDEYRLIISRDITDFYSSQAVKVYFHAMYGNPISLPPRYKPSQKFLEEHRGKGSF